MKLGEVRKIAATQLDRLSWQKKQLETMLEKPSSSNFDRVEITRELEAVKEEYQQTQDMAENLNQMYHTIANAEATRQHSEVLTEAAKDLMKILEIFRRIAKGDKVPPQDEKRLMDYNGEMYMAAKNMALLADKAQREEHDSLWDDEKPKEESPTPSDVAAGTEVGNPLAAIRQNSSGDAPEGSEQPA